jgi:hypothetical protein
MRHFTILPVMQEASGERDRLRHQAAAILAQVQDKAFDIDSPSFAARFHIARHVLRLEAGDLEEGDAGFVPEGIHQAGFDLAARHGYRDRLGVAPSRITLTRTWLPRGPRSKSATAEESFLVTSLPSTATIVSPRRRSARHAGGGERLHGDHLGTIHRDQHADPEVLPRRLRCMSWYSLGSRKLSAGRACAACPGSHPVDRLSDEILSA